MREEEYDYEDGQSVIPPQKEEREAAEIGVIRELSPKKVLEQLRMNMKGYEFDSETKKYIKIDGFVPLMNDEGISKYISAMHSVITDLVTFSNYKEGEIAQLTLYICEEVIPVIHVNYKSYGIKHKSDLGLIDTQILSLTLAALKKAVGAGDRGVIGRTIQENISNRGTYGQFQQPQMRGEKGGGFLSKMNPFSR